MGNLMVFKMVRASFGIKKSPVGIKTKIVTKFRPIFEQLFSLWILNYNGLTFHKLSGNEIMDARNTV